MTETKTFLGIGFALIIGMIIAVNLISSYGQVVAPMTSYIGVHNQSTSIATARTPDGAGVCNGTTKAYLNFFQASNNTNMSVGSFVMRNVTSGLVIDSGNYTVVYTQGNATVMLKNTSYWTSEMQLSNTTYWDYDYYDLSQYVQESLPRQFVGYTILFFALGIIAFVLYYMYKGGWLTGVDGGI